jgi:peptide deformylase
MAVLPICIWPDAVLSQRAMPVGAVDDAVRKLAADMLETMYAAPGRGLAAPQVGVSLRLFVMDTTWKDGIRSPVVVINPDLLAMSDDRAVGPEGCLSIPGVTAHVGRASEIRISWTDLDGARNTASWVGFAAICAQHEYDHLDGILTLDRLSPEARARALAEVGA